MVNWHIAAAVISGILSVSSAVPYIRDILRGGDTRPNAVSWFLWTVLQSIILVATLKAGASWSIVIVIFITINTTIVTILALIGYGYRKYGWLDAVCFVLAVVAIILWQLTGQPVLAILLAIFADLFASVPTLVKTYHDPRSENVAGWFLIMLAALIGGFSTEIFNTANLAYPIYVFFMNGAIFSLAYFGRQWLRNR